MLSHFLLPMAAVARFVSLTVLPSLKMETMEDALHRIQSENDDARRLNSLVKNLTLRRIF